MAMQPSRPTLSCQAVLRDKLRLAEILDQQGQLEVQATLYRFGHSPACCITHHVPMFWPDEVAHRRRRHSKRRRHNLLAIAVGLMTVAGLLAMAIALGWLLLQAKPIESIANVMWPDSPAPWERVDAVYYPDAGDRTTQLRERNLADLDSCREWANRAAAYSGNQHLRRGDYRCDVGLQESYGDIEVYRLTVW
jgi:hypothetical protein